MRSKILTLELICLFIFISGCKKELPTSPDITGEGYPAPYKVSATVISSSRIDLTWKNGGGYNTIKIYRNDASTRYALYETIWGNRESWSDINCTAKREYCYKLKGQWLHGPVGETDYSNEACGITPAL